MPFQLPAFHDRDVPDQLQEPSKKAKDADSMLCAKPKHGGHTSEEQSDSDLEAQLL
jgi:hypothetical protein